MPDVNDMDLVREYGTRQSETAFETLVQRHVHLVYSTALRQIGNPAQAEEITQVVFIILARKAARLRPETVLPAWLHETARYATSSYLRGEIRRRRREQEAYMQSTLQSSSDDSAWKQLAPLLDEAIGRLGTADRNAVALRYFQNKSVREIAAALNIGEDAAKKRLARAVEKLRMYFFKRGINVSTAALSSAVAAHSVQTAPAALAKTITAVALAKGATASTSTLTFIKGALKIMAWAKVKTALVVGIATLLAVSATTVVVKKITSPSVESYFTRMDSKYLNTAPPLVLLRPSRFVGQGAYMVATMDMPNPGKIMRRDCSFAAVLASAYKVDKERIILPEDAPQGQFDLLLTVPDHQAEALREEIKRQFGLVGHSETRDADALVLRVSNPVASGLKLSRRDNQIACHTDDGKMTGINLKMSDVAYYLGASYFYMPVIDETGLSKAYDFDFHWDASLEGDALKKEIQRALSEQLGLELVPDRRPIEMLVVEKANK